MFSISRENNFHDSVAVILSKNVNRKGALAMAVAMVFPQADETGGRGKKSIAKIQFLMVSKQALSHARTVLRHAPDLADLMRNNEMSLPEA